MMGNRREVYKAYINSLEWVQLKRTMPGEKVCLACDSHRKLHLHHMYYTPDIWETKHGHCCWLCERCHKAFHRAKPKGFDNIMEMTWEQLRRATRRVIRRKRRLDARIKMQPDEMEAYQYAMDRD